MSSPRARSPILRHVLLAFAGSVLLYAAGFAFLEHLRHRKGPWVVDFVTDPAGRPAVVVSQPRLGLEGVTLRFPEHSLAATNLHVRWRFDDPTRRQLPFGRVVFLDTTFLPGTVTLELFGHEIELLPRVLIINKQEHPWRSGEQLDLPARAGPVGPAQPAPPAQATQRPGGP